MTTKEELIRIVDALTEREAAEVLEYVRWLHEEAETLTAEEIAHVQAGEAEIERGERVAWDALRRELGL